MKNYNWSFALYGAVTWSIGCKEINYVESSLKCKLGVEYKMDVYRKKIDGVRKDRELEMFLNFLNYYTYNLKPTGFDKSKTELHYWECMRR